MLSEDSTVIVDAPEINLDPQVFDELVAHINPMEICSDFGIQLFVDCLNFVQHRI